MTINHLFSMAHIDRAALVCSDAIATCTRSFSLATPAIGGGLGRNESKVLGMREMQEGDGNTPREFRRSCFRTRSLCFYLGLSRTPMPAR